MIHPPHPIPPPNRPPPPRPVVAASALDTQAALAILTHDATRTPRPWVLTIQQVGAPGIVAGGSYATAEDACEALARVAPRLARLPSASEARQNAIRLWRGVLRHTSDPLNASYARAAVNRLEREERAAQSPGAGAE
jgi:hypothetical protein